MSVTSMIIHKNYKWGTALTAILLLLGNSLTVISPGFAQESQEIQAPQTQQQQIQEQLQNREQQIQERQQIQQQQIQQQLQNREQQIQERQQIQQQLQNREQQIQEPQQTQEQQIQQQLQNREQQQPQQPQQTQKQPQTQEPQQTQKQQQTQRRRQGRYGVYVNSDSPFMLEVVQQVQPGAVIRRYRGRQIIDAGIYFRSSQAERVAEDLENYGIEAEITDFEDEEEFTGRVNPALPVIPLPTEEDKPIETNVPPIYVFPEGSLGLYQVFVSVNDAAIFEVTKIAPRARVKEYQGKLIIQVGSFVNWGNAQLLADELALRGIPSEIIQSLRELQLWVAIQPEVPTANASLEPGEDEGFGLSEKDSYFVLIPGQPTDLNIIANNVISLGAPEQSVSVQNLDFDPFVAVGPFSNESLAEEWENYFIDSGLPEARIYFGR